jgi:hypothetical protein
MKHKFEHRVNSVLNAALPTELVVDGISTQINPTLYPKAD